jgi:hypothetical protein
MIRNLSLAAFLCVAVVATASAQPAKPNPEEAAILAVVDRFMDAISTNDSALMAELRIEGGSTIVARPDPAGSDTPLFTRRMFTPATSSRPSTNRERYWDPVVHVRSGIAVVWAPYEYWADGKSAHCGIDVFDLMKEKGVWRIANAMWTVEPEACAALRPSDSSKLRPARQARRSLSDTTFTVTSFFELEPSSAWVSVSASRAWLLVWQAPRPTGRTLPAANRSKGPRLRRGG